MTDRMDMSGMKSGGKLWVLAAAALYVITLIIVLMDVRQRADIRTRRMADYRTFSTLIQQTPPPSSEPAYSEPLLVRLQRSVDQMGLKDRAPKLSAGPASPGQPASVSVSIEGAPFDRIAELLERISSDAAVASPQFRLERSGASDERFDFSATFVEIRGGPAE